MASLPDPVDRSAEGTADHAALATIAAKLCDIADELQRTAGEHGGSGVVRREDGPFPPRASLVALARHAYMLRRQRAQIFGSAELFGEPAWDILLDLYIAHAEGKAVSVSSACIGSASPPTTGLRWLTVLADEGLVARKADAHDNRRIMVHLTERGIAAMERFLTLARGRPA